MSLLLLGDPPFTPKSIPGLKLWLAADRITGLVDNDPVGTWPDVSGNGNDATQATAAAKPLYKISILNGLPVVRFDGVDDLLDASTVNYAQPTTIFIVAKSANVDEDYFYDGVTTRQSLRRSGVANTISQFAGLDVAVFADLNANFHVYVSVFNGASSFTTKDGVISAPVNPGTNAITSFRIGARSTGVSPLNGDIPELGVYTRVLSIGERQQLERYGGSKYGITVA